MHTTMRKRLLSCVSAAVLASNAVSPALAATTGPNDGKTTTPIKHVIIIVGENRSFDHVFATYVPPTGTALNLLSEGIINADGTPGPNAPRATQNSAVDETSYSIAPGGKAAYTTGGTNPFPPVMTAGAPEYASNTNPAPFATIKAARHYDYGLESDDYKILTTGATGLPKYSIDTRFPTAAAPANAPFQLTPGISYDDYAASPVHRFYQMFQQMDCAGAYVTAANPSGCLNDLFPWVEVTIGAGSNGATQPAGFNNQSTGEGSASMGFYNVQQGDMPYFKQLADTYALGDNYHQPVKGGTGADSVVLGFGGQVYYQDAEGRQSCNSAVQPDRKSEPGKPAPTTGTAQDGYSAAAPTPTARTARSRRSPASSATCIQAVVFKPNRELPEGPLLPPEQLQPRLQRGRHPGDARPE